MKALTGVGPLLRFVLRRDRIYLPVWILALTATVYASIAAVRRTYDTPAEILSYAKNVGGSPASVAMAGPPVALEQVGGILIYETSLTALIGVALMAVFTVMRHTRREEDAGRVELLGSTVVSRHAVVTAAAIVSGLASVLVGAGVAASFVAEQQPLRESVLYGASIAAMGVVFTAVAAVAAQLMSHGRGAVGLSLAVLALAYGLRAVGDIQENFLSWLSPMGWSQQVRVYDDNRWWPLALSVLLSVVLMGAAVALESRRDLGSGVFPARPGPAEARPRLGTVVGLSWRLQRGSILGWSVGLFAIGLLYGSFSRSIENMIEDNPELEQYFAQTGASSIVEAFFATAMLLMAIAASGFAVSSALRTRAEESADRLESVLATAVSRPRWLLGSLLVTLLGTAVVVGVSGLGIGISYAATAGESADVLRMTGYALAYLPAPLLLAALAVLLVGWLPRASGAAWAALALVFVIGWLGDLLELPTWVDDISPFSHLPAAPAEELQLLPAAVLSALVLGTVLLGGVGFRRRDIG
ncbi:ABC transporter permease [Nocardioides pakistanensis]